jgi:hypothetical protein
MKNKSFNQITTTIMVSFFCIIFFNPIGNSIAKETVSVKDQNRFEELANAVNLQNAEEISATRESIHENQRILDDLLEKDISQNDISDAIMAYEAANQNLKNLPETATEEEVEQANALAQERQEILNNLLAKDVPDEDIDAAAKTLDDKQALYAKLHYSPEEIRDLRYGDLEIKGDGFGWGVIEKEILDLGPTKGKYAGMKRSEIVALKAEEKEIKAKIKADKKVAKAKIKADKKESKAASKADKKESKAASKADKKESKAASKADKKESKAASKADKKESKAASKADKKETKAAKKKKKDKG